MIFYIRKEKIYIETSFLAGLVSLEEFLIMEHFGDSFFFRRCRITTKSSLTQWTLQRSKQNSYKPTPTVTKLSKNSLMTSVSCSPTVLFLIRYVCPVFLLIKLGIRRSDWFARVFPSKDLRSWKTILRFAPDAV